MSSPPWSQLTEVTLLTAVSEVPVAGGLLSSLISVFWPSQSDNVDVWGEIKAQVEQLIGQAIEEEVYARVQTILGNSSDGIGSGTGLLGLMNNYLESQQNGEDAAKNWYAANNDFILNAASFQETGYEALLLPLFTQMANLHLTLLRDGCLNNYCENSALTTQTATYTAWTAKWVTQPGLNSTVGTCNYFNGINLPIRCMKLYVSPFVQIWPFLDPVYYPNGGQPNPQRPEVFYTITEQFSPSIPNDGCSWFNPPGAPVCPSIFNVGGFSTNVQQLTISNLAFPGSFKQVNAICGVDTFYAGILDQTGYQGYPQGEQPAAGTEVTDYDGYGDKTGATDTYGITTVVISDSDPIVNVSGTYLWSPSDLASCGLLYSMQFDFQSGANSGQIPPAPVPTSHTWSNTEQWTITAPYNYTLSSFYMPASQNGEMFPVPSDAAFGFRTGITDPSDYPQIFPTADGWVTGFQSSGNWVEGYSVQYAVAWQSYDGSMTNPGNWCAPITSSTSIQPTIDFSSLRDTPGVITSWPNMVVWRQFAATGFTQIVAIISMGLDNPDWDWTWQDTNP